MDPDRRLKAKVSTSAGAAPDHLELRLWLRLLACTNLIEAPLRSKLRARFEVTLPRFDLMAQLDRHPKGLSMHELSQRLMVTGGNVTGLIQRLVEEGMVLREPSHEDRRRINVRLSALGRRQFKTMAQHHEAWVDSLFSGLTATDKAQLFDVLGRLKTTLKKPVRPGR